MAEGTYGRMGIARTYALVFGIAYVAVALIEVIIGRDGWTAGDTVLLALTPFHNLIHWATGIVLLGSFFLGMRAAKMTALVIGIVFAVITLWGFIDRDSLGDFVGYEFPLPWTYNIIHLLTAAAALYAGLASERGYGTGEQRMRRAA